MKNVDSSIRQKLVLSGDIKGPAVIERPKLRIDNHAAIVARRQELKKYVVAPAPRKEFNKVPANA